MTFPNNNNDNDEYDWQWRIPFLVQTIPSSILAIGILICPHSPRWLISQDREREAKNVLMKIRSISHDKIDEEFIRIRNEVAYLREYEVETYRQLFRFPLRRPLLLGIGIQILQQLTGINSTIYYAPRIFMAYSKNFDNLSPEDQQLSFIMTGIYGCINVIFTIPTMVLIDRLGRRILLITGAGIMSISMLIVTIMVGKNQKYDEGFYYIEDNAAIITIITFICVFVASFAYSWGPVPWMYCTEIFPLTMRAKATSLTTAANWATNCAISYLVPTLLFYFHYGLFLMFAILCSIMIVIIYLFYPETKNRHLEDNRNNENTGILIPQWLKYRTKPNRIFSQQPIVNPIHNSIISNLDNLHNQSNSIECK